MMATFAAPQTPFLALDMPAFERNIKRMADTIVVKGGKRWRPHVKAIKTPALVQRLIAAGARGITCAKLSEAEVMVAAGIDDVLIANQVVGADKVRLLAELNRRARVIVAVDSHAHLQPLAEAAAAAGTVIPVMIEVDVGLQRAGATPGAAVVEIARLIHARPQLEFVGVMAWEGHTTAIENPADKETQVRVSVESLLASARACIAAGIEVDTVSCGGTGTYQITSAIAGVTEIQAGGGVFGDVRYRDELHVDLECALTLQTTVVSRPTARRIVCDAGWKATGRYPTLPVALNTDGVQAIVLSAEHASIELEHASDRPQIGERLRFAVGYSDSTVFLHEVIYGMRDGVVEAGWPVAARGKLW